MTDSRQQAPSSTGSPARQQPAGEAAPESKAPTTAQTLPDQGAGPAAPRRRRGHRRVSTGGAAASPGAAFNLKAAEDEPAAWGDKGEDRESWLKAQRPPHWG
ncbi:hypothetical protein BN1051_02167 [Arthrobacter saudimassiliensis]|uniref:Uncharacterized protein n=1 Tax=Arthrobacter saudimassiliensis TaxID=1461584 RepID=A0A078MRA0_9MICC|nr:hypothetical protein BN1051_02167 [Arthrobacter saudimassiliensis]